MRDDRQVVIGALGLVIACVAIAVGLLNPEIRYFLGLDQRQNARLDEPAPAITGANVQPTSASPLSLRTPMIGTPNPLAFWVEDFPTRVHVIAGGDLVIAFTVHLNPLLQETKTLQPIIIARFELASTGDISKTYKLYCVQEAVAIAPGESHLFKATIKTYTTLQWEEGQPGEFSCGVPPGKTDFVLSYWAQRAVSDKERTYFQWPQGAIINYEQSFTDINGNEAKIQVDISE